MHVCASVTMLAAIYLVFKGVDKWGLRGLKPLRFLTKLIMQYGSDKKENTKFC